MTHVHPIAAMLVGILLLATGLRLDRFAFSLCFFSSFVFFLLFFFIYFFLSQNNDGVGDACDYDGDSFPDDLDNCPYIYNVRPDCHLQDDTG
jgi:hypothetical protein